MLPFRYLPYRGLRLRKANIKIGLIASEKQAIDATLNSLHTDYPEIPTVAGRYWNTRGGFSHDSGAFAFTVSHNNGQVRLTATDKFNQQVTLRATKSINQMEQHS